MKVFGVAALTLLSTVFDGALANQRVMEFVRRSHEKLHREGVFDKARSRESVTGGERLVCTEGSVTVDGEVFPCENVDFYSFISQKDLNIADPPHRVGASSADIWGWLSPTGREFTLLALDNGVAVIDSSDPLNPCIVAKMPTGRVVDKWGDVKVYENAMYHVKDTGVQDEDSPNSTYGIEVYDLLPFDEIDCSTRDFVPREVSPDFVSTVHGRSHNVAVNPESGLIYSTGSQECDQGLVILSGKENPLKPELVGCADQDGYTHDVQCLTYDGPDRKYRGDEICFAFNEDTLTIWKVTEPANPVVVSKAFYDNQVYSHQGWVNDDLTLVLLDDELDELCNDNFQSHGRCDDFSTTVLTGELRTTTNVFNIEDLENPVFQGAYVHPDNAVDHNLYVWGTVHRKGWGGNPAMEKYPDPNFAYMNNYVAGVKIVDIHSNDFREWTQAGFFDIAPDLDGYDFAGAWSGYMHPSGVYAVSSIERGLFFLQPHMAYTQDFPDANGQVSTPPTTPGDGGDSPTPGDGGDSPTPGDGGDSPTPGDGGDSPTPGESDDDEERSGALIAIAVIMLIGLVLMIVSTAYRQSRYHKQHENEEEVQALQSQFKTPPSSTANPTFKLDADENVEKKPDL